MSNTSKSDRGSRDALLTQLAALERAARPLNPGTSRRRAVRDRVIAYSERFLRKIETLKAYTVTEDKGAGLLESPIGEEGLPVGAVLDLLHHNVDRPGLNPASPGHLAYVPGGGIYYASLGDYLAAVTNRYAGIFHTGPGPVRMENMLLRWMADLVGYPSGAGGNLASGGSIANLVAIATARDAHGLKGADFGQAVVYLTHQVHTASTRRFALRDSERVSADICRWTKGTECGWTRWKLKSPPIGPRDSGRGWSSPRRARRMSEPWTHCRRSGLSPNAKVFGSTSTRPTADSFC